MSFLAVSKKDMQRYPLLFLWRADRYHGGTWSAVLCRPRPAQWRILTVNVVLAVVFLGSFIAVGTPILGKSYTWWLLAFALLVALTLGLNCMKLFYVLTGHNKSRAHE